MKRKSIVVIFLLVVFASTVFLGGCELGKGSKSVVGTWLYYTSDTPREDIYYTFNADKTGSYTFYGESKNFTYEDSGTKLTIKYDKATDSSEFEYSIDKNIMTIKDSFGNDVTYKRK